MILFGMIGGLVFGLILVWLGAPSWAVFAFSALIALMLVLYLNGARE